MEKLNVIKVNWKVQFNDALLIDAMIFKDGHP